MTMQVTLHRQRFFCVPEYYKIPSQLPRILMARGKGGNIRLHWPCPKFGWQCFPGLGRGKVAC